MAELEQLELDVRGMTCDSCAIHVTKALKSVTGVQEADVPGWQSGRATVVVGADVDAKAIGAAVQQAGYTATVKTRKAVGGPAPENVNGGHQFDLMVIGGGSAGFAAAIKGAELGFRVALVEAGVIGGTCVNVGCVPSKTLIRSVELYHLAGQHRFRGVHTAPGRIHWPEVIAHKDELVNELRQAKYSDVLAAYPEITLIRGRARLTVQNGVEIAPADSGGAGVKAYAPGKIVISTGARQWAPPIPGLGDIPYLDSTAALDLKELPKSMIVLGANAVGLELAQTYARAGTYVTALEVLPRIAPFEDEDLSAALAGYLEEEGLRIVPNFKTTKVERRDGRYILTGTKNEAEVVFEAEQLLVATGRRPNTAGLGLEEAGVRLGQRGEILANDSLQTHNPFVYAAGDVTGRDMFVYVAAYSGQLAAENALTNAGRVYDAAYIPRITFTDPQVASAGLTEAQAREQGYEVRVSNLPMAHVTRALAARDTRGLIKLILNAATDQLLGAHIIAPEAGEMIQTAVLAIRFGITAPQLRETMFPYLTNAEGLKLATLAFDKDVAKLSCCAG
jgi:mercuric reductase